MDNKRVYPVSVRLSNLVDNLSNADNFATAEAVIEKFCRDNFDSESPDFEDRANMIETVLKMQVESGFDDDGTLSRAETFAAIDRAADIFDLNHLNHLDSLDPSMKSAGELRGIAETHTHKLEQSDGFNSQHRDGVVEFAQLMLRHDDLNHWPVEPQPNAYNPNVGAKKAYNPDALKETFGDVKGYAYSKEALSLVQKVARNYLETDDGVALMHRIDALTKEQLTTFKEQFDNKIKGEISEAVDKGLSGDDLQERVKNAFEKLINDVQEPNAEPSADVKAPQPSQTPS